jgi:hypothetical protein
MVWDRPEYLSRVAPFTAVSGGLRVANCPYSLLAEAAVTERLP